MAQRKDEDLAMNIRVITHNIRYATANPFPGEEKWPIRCPRLCSELVFNSASIPATFICLQEVLNPQLADVLSGLNASASEKYWDYIGVGREDGVEAGEYSPILYRPSEWKLIQWQTKWLSPTPEKPSKGWDASSTRIVTIGCFEHRRTGTNLLLSNTHLDNQGVKSRQESAKLILHFIQKLSDVLAPGAILLTGDFNSPPNDGAYQIMTDPKTGMEDVGIKVPKEKRYGNEITFTSFGHIDNTPSRIDFIFARAQRNLRYLNYAVLANKFDDGIYLSDHRACVTDLRLLLSD